MLLLHILPQDSDNFLHVAKYIMVPPPVLHIKADWNGSVRVALMTSVAQHPMLLPRQTIRGTKEGLMAGMSFLQHLAANS